MGVLGYSSFLPDLKAPPLFSSSGFSIKLLCTPRKRLTYIYCFRMASSLEDFSQFDISREVFTVTHFFDLLIFYAWRFHVFLISEISMLQEKDKLVAEVIRYVLFKTHQSSGCPIKRDDLTQLITKNYRQRGLPSLIINEAREKLSSIFGYEMKELQRVRPSTNQGLSSQQSEKLLPFLLHKNILLWLMPPRKVVLCLYL